MFTDFTPETIVQEAQDAMGFKIWDASTWNDESALCTKADVHIIFVNDEDVETLYDVYPLIVGQTKTKFNEYLDRDGHVIDTSALTIGGVAAPELFEEGYYIIRVIYSDGTYQVGAEPYFDNEHAFLAKTRCMARVLPKVLSWPLTEEMYRKNRDIFMLNMYLASAENDVDLGRIVSFRRTMALIKKLLDNYSLEECF